MEKKPVTVSDMLTPLRSHGLYDAYRFSGCTTRKRVHGVFGDPHAIVLLLIRRGKKLSAVPVIPCNTLSTTAGCARSAIFPAAIDECFFRCESVAFAVHPAKP